LAVLIVVKIQGGLGNQLFQYAAGIAAATRVGTSLAVDLSWYDEATEWWRPYELDKFGVLTPPEIRDVEETLEGYFVSDKYFSDAQEQVRAAFSFQGKVALPPHDLPAVSIHIRRGSAPDFQGEAKADPSTEVLTVEYYRKAIDLIEDLVGNVNFFVFSDDPDWCRKNLEIDATYPEQSGFDDLQLMSLCDHHIVANSSFSWWGAWLNRRPKIVICPEGDHHVVFPEHWVRV
jgi:hypothetical protein